jgi:hypothetical protein
MSQKFSYKDVLMKDPEKQFEVGKKSNVYEFSRRDIKKICTSGNLDQLKKIPLTQFTEDNKTFLLKTMKDKVLEIEMWKYEDQNQLSGKLEELDNRINGINDCINYIENVTFSKI